jgi:hypothetical protein
LTASYLPAESPYNMFKQVARLQEITATLENLNKKTSLDYELLKQEAGKLKEQFERENESAANLTRNLKDQLTTEQLNNSKVIAKLQDEIKSKEVEMTKLQSTAVERSQLVADLKLKLEKYQAESEKIIENSKKKVASTDAFLREQSGTIYSHMIKSSGEGNPSLPSTNVIGSNFATREKNVATVRENNFSSNQSSNNRERSPMSGWAGYKDAQYGGYLDNLSAPSPQAQQREYAVNQYRNAEKQLLLEAKALSKIAANSLEEARAFEGSGNKKKYEETLARAAQERARVDKLFVEAANMKSKAESSMMP